MLEVVEVRQVEGELYTRTELVEPEDSCGNQFVFRDTDSGAVTTIQRRHGGFIIILVIFLTIQVLQ